jgi:predicted membrane protein
MIESIISTVFSVEYLVIGVLLAALLDIGIHYTKSTTRFTLLEIWGCTMCWPFVLVILFFAFIFGQKE